LLAVSVATLLLSTAPLAIAGAPSSLTISPAGLPKGQPMSLSIHGPSTALEVTSSHESLTGLHPGRYAVTVKPVAIARATGRIPRGATAYPARRRLVIDVKPARAARLIVAYAGIVNPTVRPVPKRILRVLGDPMRPKAILLSAQAKPTIGTIFTSGPSRALPYGLISKVLRVVHGSRGSVRAYLRAVSIGEAVPQLEFAGALPLTLPPGGAPGTSAGAPAGRMASGCGGPTSLFAPHAHLDGVELRQASLGALPPQLRLTLAVRTTEALGVSAAAIGINCSWQLGQIGPYQGAFPIGPVVIPVFATIPVRASAHVEGKLEAGKFNVASTTVATVAAGAQENDATLAEQGTNVWVEGSPSIVGTAGLSATIGLQAGIGVVEGANVHLEADFGPEFNWSSGHACTLVANFGKLSAGVSLLGHELTTHPYAGAKVPLWTGCAPTTTPSPTTSTPTPPSPSAAPPPPPSAAPPGFDRHAITSYNRVEPGAPHHGYFDVAWQPFTAKSNTITELGATVGNPALAAGEPVPYNLTLRLCSAQPASDGTCPGQLAEVDPQIVNYGATLADIGDVAVTPGATYWIEWLQPPSVAGNTWVTYWWAGGGFITSSEELQALARGYNR
jgi:hypothetical protein